MDKRVIGQLNSELFAQYLCSFDGEDVIFDGKNDGVKKILGICDCEKLDKRSLFDVILSNDAPRLKRDLLVQLNNGDEIELMLMTRDGSWVLNRGLRTTVDGKTYLVGLFVVISKFKTIYDTQKTRLAEYEQKLTETTARASCDSLTMLYNTKTTRDLCEEYISHESGSFAMMIIDIDGFKKINDNYGHIVGDEVLVMMSSIFKRLFRNNDIVGRIGGDEFLVLMKDVEDIEIVKKKCAQIVDLVSEMASETIPKGEMSCSVGVVMAKTPHLIYDELFCIADKTMYSAKQNGGNRFELIEA
ncbi:MAG: GGDEF domain-containing protein [Clostridia bacterium]|nr:GGDEF domain-containing protein [Clostridia bacterium]MBQ6905970.1 GGDEF domain-containing protein [Clostridia bacterium]